MCEHCGCTVDAATLAAGRCSVEAHDRMCATCREQQRRDAIADRANDAAAGCIKHPGAPTLAEDSSRETLIEWLMWNDPNGSHTDAMAENEGADPYTVATAWDAIAAMLDADAPEGV